MANRQEETELWQSAAPRVDFLFFFYFSLFCLFFSPFFFFGFGFSAVVLFSFFFFNLYCCFWVQGGISFCCFFFVGVVDLWFCYVFQRCCSWMVVYAFCFFFVFLVSVHYIWVPLRAPLPRFWPANSAMPAGSSIAEQGASPPPKLLKTAKCPRNSHTPVCNRVDVTD